MKKHIITLTLIAIAVAGSITLTAFTTKHNEKNGEVIVTTNNEDAWKLFRENVAYCDGDKDMCEGTGYVWVNTETYQAAFSFG